MGIPRTTEFSYTVLENSWGKTRIPTAESRLRQQGKGAVSRHSNLSIEVSASDIDFKKEH
jgi:hypothetical protein